MDGIGNLTSLEELRIGGIPNRLLKELGSLRELRVLEFSTHGMDESMQLDFVESLRDLKNIQHIEVDGCLSFSKQIQPCGRQQALCSHDLLVIWSGAITSQSYPHA